MPAGRPDEMLPRGQLHLLFGPMRGAKSLHLIQWMESALEEGQAVHAFYPAGSSRWGVAGIASRGGQRPPAAVQQHAWGEPAVLPPGAAIAVDEGQFCAGLAAQLGAWLAAGHDVAVAMLNQQWTGAPWPAYLDALAVSPTRYVHLTARCVCRGEATRTAARAEHPGATEVVGDELYVPLCEACWARRGELGYRTA